MKTYSDNSVTPADVEAAKAAAVDIALAANTMLDAKQSRQIRQLRLWLVIATAANMLFSLVIHFAR